MKIKTIVVKHLYKTFWCYKETLSAGKYKLLIHPLAPEFWSNVIVSSTKYFHSSKFVLLLWDSVYKNLKVLNTARFFIMRISDWPNKMHVCNIMKLQ
jgi:hypothetical protein